MHWTTGSVGLATQMSAFYPRDWSKDGHVTLTRPVCVYPEVGSWTLDKRDFCGLIRLLVSILCLSLGPHPLPCNFAGLPLKMWNIFPCPLTLDLATWLLVNGMLVNMIKAGA